MGCVGTKKSVSKSINNDKMGHIMSISNRNMIQ